MPIPRRIFDTRIIGGLLQIPKAMIQNKREGGSQEPCSKNINQAHPGDNSARALVYRFSSFLLIPLLRNRIEKLSTAK